MTSTQICQCQSPQIISDSMTGEIICKNCGIVLESHTIGHSTSNEKNTTHRHDYGIGTELPKLNYYTAPLRKYLEMNHPLTKEHWSYSRFYCQCCKRYQLLNPSIMMHTFWQENASHIICHRVEQR